MARRIGSQQYDYSAVPAPQIRIAVIGGGHGQSCALRGLKQYTEHLTGIVSVSDDGGSSGMLREDLGILPPGDIRNCITALSDTEPLWEQLLDYRFHGGTLENQSFGNLLLAAMYGVSGSFQEAVDRMCHIFHTHGTVVPVTQENVMLQAEFDDGRICSGESSIFYDKKKNDCRIREVRLVPPHPKASEAAVRAILEADLVVIGPGSLYTSILPNFLTYGITQALRETSALRVFVMNVMTQDGETEGYTGYDHIRAFIDHAGAGLIDAVLANNTQISPELRAKYSAENCEPIDLRREAIEALGIRVFEAPLAGEETGYARHTADKLAGGVMQLYRELRG